MGGRLIGWLVCLLVGWLVGWLVGRSLHWLNDRVLFLSVCSCISLVGWLVCWLVDCMIVSLLLFVSVL